MGRSWRETDEEHTDLAALIVDFLDYNDPVRVVAFNIGEGRVRDASQTVDLIAHGRERDGFHVPPFLRSFVEKHGSGRPVRQLPLITRLLGGVDSQFAAKMSIFGP